MTKEARDKLLRLLTGGATYDRGTDILTITADRCAFSLVATLRRNALQVSNAKAEPGILSVPAYGTLPPGADCAQVGGDARTRGRRSVLL